MPRQISDSGVHLWLLLAKAAKTFDAHARRSVESLGMCLSDFAVLEALLHKGPLPVNTIGRKILLTSGSITTAVDRLERRGLVTRKPDAEDRRARVVHLTPAGSTLIERLYGEHRRDMEKAASVLTAEEIKILADALRKLGTGAQRLLEESKEKI